MGGESVICMMFVHDLNYLKNSYILNILLILGLRSLKKEGASKGRFYDVDL